MRFVIAILLVFANYALMATSQEPDVLYYKDEKLSLITGWGHPSPLELYYVQNRLEYPFKMISTGNYRGHIAAWKIENNKLYLHKISVRSEDYFPSYFNVQSSDLIRDVSGNVFAGWYSGMIKGVYNYYNYNGERQAYYYFQIRNGNIVDSACFQEDEYFSILRNADNAAGTSNISNNRLIELEDQYVCFYYRLMGEDTLKTSEKDILLIGPDGLSPLLQLFDYKILSWPYNWENLFKYGAPRCRWLLRNDSLFITDISIYSGCSFSEIDVERLSLSCFFDQTEEGKPVFCSWITDAFLLKYPLTTIAKEKDDFMKSYKEKKIMVVQNGRLKKMVSLPDYFSPYTVPKNLDDEILSLIEKVYRRCVFN